MSIHIRKEIEKLKTRILSLATMVEENVRNSHDALKGRDENIARKVVEFDEKIDAMEMTVEEECLKILALYQPVAVDLRFVIAIMKMNNELEHIGDLAVDIAGKVRLLISQDPTKEQFDFTEMFDKTQAMLKKSIDAMMDTNDRLAREVCLADDEVDDLKNEMREKVVAAMEKHPDQVRQYLGIIGIARSLERMADLSSNIAEDCIYLCEGDIVRHKGWEETSD